MHIYINARKQDALAYKSQNLGFTLLEKMIVIAVMGILAVIAVPSLAHLYSRIKLDQAVAEIQSALDETQRAAIRENKICALILNLVEGEISGDCLTGGSRKISSDISLATNMLNFVGFNEPQPASLVFTDVQPSWGIGSAKLPILMAMGTSTPSRQMTAGMEVYVISSGSPDCSGWKKLLPWCWNWGNGQPPPETTTTVIPIAFGVLGNPAFEVASSSETPSDPSGKIVLHIAGQGSIPKKCVAISKTLGLVRVGDYEGDINPIEITDNGTCQAKIWQAQ